MQANVWDRLRVNFGRRHRNNNWINAHEYKGKDITNHKFPQLYR